MARYAQQDQETIAALFLDVRDRLVGPSRPHVDAALERM